MSAEQAYINGKDIYDEMSKIFTTEQLLKNAYESNTFLDMAENTTNRAHAHEKLSQYINEKLEDGSLFSKVLEKNNMRALDYLAENYESNSHLVEQVIDEQAPYITHFLSMKYGEVDFEIDQDLFKEYITEYLPNNSSLNDKVKRYFDREFSNDHTITNEICEKTELYKDIETKYRYAKHIIDETKEMKEKGTFNQDYIDEWLKSKDTSNKSIDKEKSVDDFKSYCNRAKLRDKLENKLQEQEPFSMNKPRQGLAKKMKSQGMKI